MVFEKILSEKRTAVQKRQQERPLQTFGSSLVHSDRSLAQALLADQTGFILECKKASPSKGMIRPNFQVSEIAKAYSGLANAISVITDEPFFQGQLSFLKEAREHSSCPIICKDFVISPYQVYEARLHGADAILLMMSVLDDAAFGACFDACNKLSMDALVEIHDEKELERAISLGARIIGINNRDFKTLNVDLANIKRLAPLVPADRITVAESGFYSHQEIREHRASVDAFLVGTSLMEQPRVDLATRELVFGRAKVCGLTNGDDALAAYQAGACYGGLIFAKESPRLVSIEIAKQITKTIPLRFVGVFVNEDINQVSRIAGDLNLYAVQLHGEESPTYVSELRSLLPQACEIWKVIRVKDAIPPLKESGADRLLLDTFRDHARGGTGEVFDWSLLANYPNKEKIILSGGLSPANVAKADALGVFALDVNSRVEAAPGKKDPNLVREFFSQLRGKRREK